MGRDAAGAGLRPASLPPDLDQVLSHVRGLHAIEAASLQPAQRAEWLVGLQQLADAVAASSLQLLAAFDAAGDGETLHAARSTTAWLRGALGISGSAAAGRVTLARASRSHLRGAVDRLRTGELTYEHVQVIAHASEKLPPDQRPAASAMLTTLAVRVGVNDLRTAATHLRNVMDPDGGLAASEHDYTRRRLTLSPLLDGMTAVDGLLDPEAAATLTAALQPFLTPSGPEDSRNTPQRRADGLTALAQVALTQTQLPVTGGMRPQISVLTAPGLLAATPNDQPPAGSALLEPGPGGRTAVGALTAQRIACDSLSTRLMLDNSGAAVALGRTHRLFSNHQRRLLSLRDGGCRFPGCELPPAFTDAHHLLPWQAGGTTDLANGLLVCRHHHRTLHEGGWRATPDDPHVGAGGPITFTAPHRPIRLVSAPRPLATEQFWTHPPPDSG